MAPSGSPGLLSGRPWCARPPVPPPVLEAMRRVVPLDVPVSDRLLTVLACRGLTQGRELESFFYPSLEHLPDPFLMREMDRAADRILAAARRGEHVAVHGDFDVDGITGTALLTELLRNLQVDGRRPVPVPAFVPDRAADGYGVADRMIRQWARDGVHLLITVDTGTAALEELALARELGLDVVVLDHHICEQRPDVHALVNPRREDSTYPNPELCGVAVAFKVAQALTQLQPNCLPEGFLAEIIDLVALGLVADQMPLVGENRVLVRKGLERFADRQRLRPGLAALLRIAGLDRGFPVTATDLAYQVAPRLNACGRIGRVMAAFELLLTRDERLAERLAQEADRTNLRRKQADLMLKDEAVAMALPYVERGEPGLVLWSAEWHKGVIGIGAARLVEQFRLPTILVAVEGDMARGSARSTPNVDVKCVLDRCAQHLVRYGGHAQAAGVSLRARDLPEFRRAFLAALRDEPNAGPMPELYDLELPLGELTARDVADLVAEFEQLEPFGSGNRRPVFRCRGVLLARHPSPMGGGVHLRFAFRGPNRPPTSGAPALGREFVAFGSGEAWRRGLSELDGGEQAALRTTWDVLFELGRSTFRPRNGTYDPVQQLLVDIRPASTP
ncbi:MAG: single-stranded-DNA-specific exonuclease RecJ [Candidatus Krumholzibacteriia bacterium]